MNWLYPKFNQKCYRSELVKRSWEIELITLKEVGVLAKYLNKKIKVKNLNVKSSFKFTKFFITIFKLIKIFKKNPYTLTHFFLPQAYIVGMISSIIAKAKCKLVMSRRSLNYYQKKIILFGGTMQQKLLIYTHLIVLLLSNVRLYPYQR